VYDKNCFKIPLYEYTVLRIIQKLILQQEIRLHFIIHPLFSTMGIKSIPSDTPRTDNHTTPTGLPRENGTSLLATDSRRSDVNIRAVSIYGCSPTPSFPWKCTRTRRQAICEVREESFLQNGVTLKHFRKYLVSTFARERIGL
jgi:hypothetical protein